jgi:hypothetical protein
MAHFGKVLKEKAALPFMPGFVAFESKRSWLLHASHLLFINLAQSL